MSPLIFIEMDVTGMVHVFSETQEEVKPLSAPESPEPEEFSGFYRSDDIMCYVSNAGIAHEVSDIPVVRIQDLHSWRRKHPRD